MKVAYVDTSCVVAIAFGERSAKSLHKTLAGFDRLLSSNLLDAELRAVFAREKVAYDAAVIEGIEWIIPDRMLTAELDRVFSAGYVRGADAWHLATALFVASDPAHLSFLTLDTVQDKAARTLGFRTR